MPCFSHALQDAVEAMLKLSEVSRALAILTALHLSVEAKIDKVFSMRN